jgi:DNA-binding response OmpR family regulator
LAAGVQVAVADDDQVLIGQVLDLLKGAGMGAEGFRSGAEVIAALRRETYDVVLLDWNMPGGSGIDVLDWAAQNLKTPPAFILMTARSEPDDIVAALEHGACDYIVKPENGAVVLARIRAAARRSAPRSKERFLRCGVYELDNLQSVITVGGEPVDLTAKEFSLARTFLENINRPLSRSYLLSEIWGHMEELETRTLDMHVSRLRTKLALRPENGFAIRSVFGFGYRLDRFD